MEKWYYVFAGLAFLAIFGGMAYSMGEKSHAKRDVLVACYKSGAKDCPQQVEQAFKGD